MTARAAFTEAQIRRVIRAAEKAGYRVGGLRPDGTVLVYTGDERPAELSIAPAATEDAEVDTWADR
jgi:hypothetical protein